MEATSGQSCELFAADFESPNDALMVLLLFAVSLLPARFFTSIYSKRHGDVLKRCVQEMTPVEMK